MNDSSRFHLPFAESRALQRLAALIIVSCYSLVIVAQASDAAEEWTEAKFNESIGKLLAVHCLECHSAGLREGGLDLASKIGFEEGGDSGKVIQQDSLEQSLLWQKVSTGEMPPEGPGLSQEELEQLRSWIASGAPWPIEKIDPFVYSSERRAGYDWWSLRPVVDHPSPRISDDDWSESPIDAFILEKLKAQELSPAPLADRRTLLRRVYFDLTGLPPDQEALQSFLSDDRPDAWPRLVDRLLASPELGERWGRHWLDVVRFGESQGYERNRIRNQAWRYRDWVVDAFNSGMPFDEFVKQQLAGDVLHPEDYQATIATGYHVIGTWDQVAFLEGSEAMKAVARQDHVEDLVATFGQAFLGFTVQCARCHDHKYDPIAQRDYYKIAAAFAGVWQNEKETEGVRLRDPRRVGPAAGAGEWFEGSAHLPAYRDPQPTHVLARGRLDQPLDLVSPGALTAVALRSVPRDETATATQAQIDSLAPDAPDRERRLALANWVTDPQQPLTPRVIVNRWWHYHFGVGIVDTPSDLGFSGGRPSHPELLDALTADFLASDWDLKRLHRRMVLSATYRLASQHPRAAEYSQVDAEAKFRWRAGLRPLEGEAVRDAMLVAANLLQRKIGGSSYLDVHVNLNQNHEFTEPLDEINADTCRRTIYRLWARSGNLPMLQSLDCPDPAVMAPRRLGTITPLQALSLQNGALANRCAEELARLAEQQAGSQLSDQIEFVFIQTLQRRPTSDELESAIGFVEQTALSDLCLALFNSNEFAFVD